MNSTAIGLIVDGLDGTSDCLNFGFHYSIAGFEIYAGEMLLSMLILILFGWLNVIGVKKAGIVQTVLSSLLVICVFVLFISALLSSKAKGVNMEPIWSFDKAAAIAAGAATGRSENMHIRALPVSPAPSSPPLPSPLGLTSASTRFRKRQKNSTSASGKSASS